jgi:hypothetical protein
MASHTNGPDDDFPAANWLLDRTQVAGPADATIPAPADDDPVTRPPMLPSDAFQMGPPGLKTRGPQADDSGSRDQQGGGSGSRTPQTAGTVRQQASAPSNRPPAPADDEPDPFTMETRTIGRYQIVRELGRGAMGIVYRAYDPVIGRTVALKTIKFGGAAEELECRKRLYREASAAGVLTHPNIVTVHDIIEDGDAVAVAMEFIEGETLAAVIKARAPLPPCDALALFEPICAALDYAGSRGIVHRDIKPANILVGTDGRPHIADFGIARVQNSNLTSTGVVLGSPSYMSPEQVQGQPLDRRSDLFAAATICYEMLTGQNPFRGDDIAQTMYRIVFEKPRPPHELHTGLDAALGPVMERALAKNPDERYPTGGELAAALKAALTAIVSGPADLPLRVEPLAAESLPPRAQRHATLVIGAILAVMAVAGGGVLWQRAQQGTNQAGATVSQEVTQPLPASEPVSPGRSTSRGATRPAKTDPVQKPAAGRGVERERPPAPADAPKTGATAVKADAPPAAPPAPPPTAAAPVVDVAFEGEPFTIIMTVNGKRLPSVHQNQAVTLEAGKVRIHAASDAVYYSQDWDMDLRTGDRQKLAIPGITKGSCTIEPDGEAAYNGVKIYLDDDLLDEPYPPQVAKVAAGRHKFRYEFESGPYAGRKLEQVFVLQAGRLFLIRATPESGQLVMREP